MSPTRVSRITIGIACIVSLVACTRTPGSGSRAAAPSGATEKFELTSVTGAITPPLSPRNANYSIDARLDPETRTITASATIEWRNITENPTSELRFHFYWNAWKDMRSTYMRELAATRSVSVPQEDFSSLEVGSMRLLSPVAVDLMAARQFVAPDSGRAEDNTVMIVRLPRPIAPEETAAIELTWTAHVPRPFARTGAVGNFFFIAQWFPKLGVLENEGWNAHEFHASTEFFSDYGVYDVRLTVPHGWTVGATGVERSRADNDDETTTHRYYQEDVHDFAWTSSPDYVEEIAWFQPTVTGGRANEPVRMRLLLQKEHQGQTERHFDATRAALQSFGEWFGPYPYGHITIVDAAYQGDADGMEYPTFFTAGTRWLIPNAVTITGPEEVVMHEAAHQWWYGMVGSNEFEDAWIDEGISTYVTARALQARYPETYLESRFFGGFVPWAFKDIRLSRETYWNRRAGYRGNAKSDDPSRPSYQFHPVTGQYVTYNKTSLWLNTAERWLGWPAMRQALQLFFERYRFKHPEPGDFFTALAEAANRDLTWFVDAVYRSSDVFDYGVESLRSASEGNQFRTSVIVRRYGEAVFPVDIAVTFEDGSRVTEQWDGRDRWILYTYDRSSRGMSAQVDPERVLLLDINYTNNSKTLSPKSSEAATKWSLKWMVWLQDAILTWAFLM
jgi:hypothetical protein